MLGPGDLPMSAEEITIAKERGRQKSLAALIANPVRRAEIEQQFGLAFCQRKWPELYSHTTVKNLWQGFLDRTFGAYGRTRTN